MDVEYQAIDDQIDQFLEPIVQEIMPTIANELLGIAEPQIIEAKPKFMEALASYIRKGANSAAQDFKFTIYRFVDSVVQVTDDGEHFFESENICSKLSTFYHVETLIGKQLDIKGATFVGIESTNKPIDLQCETLVLDESITMMPFQQLTNCLTNATIIKAFSIYYASRGNDDSIIGMSCEESDSNMTISKSLAGSHQSSQKKPASLTFEVVPVLGKRELSQEVEVQERDSLGETFPGTDFPVGLTYPLSRYEDPIKHLVVPSDVSLHMVVESMTTELVVEDVIQDQAPGLPILHVQNPLYETPAEDPVMAEEVIDGNTMNSEVIPSQEITKHVITQEVVRITLKLPIVQDTPNNRNKFIDGIPGELECPSPLDRSSIKLTVALNFKVVKTKRKQRRDEFDHQLDLPSCVEQIPSRFPHSIEPDQQESMIETAYVSRPVPSRIEHNLCLPVSENSMFSIMSMQCPSHSMIQNANSCSNSPLKLPMRSSVISQTKNLPSRAIEVEKEASRVHVDPIIVQSVIVEEVEPKAATSNRRKPMQPVSLHTHISTLTALNSSIVDPFEGAMMETMTESSVVSGGNDPGILDLQAHALMPESDLIIVEPPAMADSQPRFLQIPASESSEREKPLVVVSSPQQEVLETMAVIAVLTRETKNLVREIDQRYPKKKDLYGSLVPFQPDIEAEECMAAPSSSSTRKMVEAVAEIVELPLVVVDDQQAEIFKLINEQSRIVKKALVNEVTSKSAKIPDLGSALCSYRDTLASDENRKEICIVEDEISTIVEKPKSAVQEVINLNASVALTDSFKKISILNQELQNESLEVIRSQKLTSEEIRPRTNWAPSKRLETANLVELESSKKNNLNFIPEKRAIHIQEESMSYSAPFVHKSPPSIRERSASKTDHYDKILHDLVSNVAADLTQRKSHQASPIKEFSVHGRKNSASRSVSSMSESINNRWAKPQSTTASQIPVNHTLSQSKPAEVSGKLIDLVTDSDKRPDRNTWKKIYSVDPEPPASIDVEPLAKLTTLISPVRTPAVLSPVKEIFIGSPSKPTALMSPVRTPTVLSPVKQILVESPVIVVPLTICSTAGFSYSPTPRERPELQMPPVIQMENPKPAVMTKATCTSPKLLGWMLHDIATSMISGNRRKQDTSLEDVRELEDNGMQTEPTPGVFKKRVNQRKGFKPAKTRVTVKDVAIETVDVVTEQMDALKESTTFPKSQIISDLIFSNNMVVEAIIHESEKRDAQTETTEVAKPFTSLADHQEPLSLINNPIVSPPVDSWSKKSKFKEARPAITSIISESSEDEDNLIKDSVADIIAQRRSEQNSSKNTAGENLHLITIVEELKRNSKKSAPKVNIRKVFDMTGELSHPDPLLINLEQESLTIKVDPNSRQPMQTSPKIELVTSCESKELLVEASEANLQLNQEVEIFKALKYLEWEYSSGGRGTSLPEDSCTFKFEEAREVLKALRILDSIK